VGAQSLANVVAVPSARFIPGLILPVEKVHRPEAILVVSLALTVG
jgi:hypothetical protein